MSLPHTWLAWVGRGWSSSKLGAQCCPCVESVVRRTKDLGCKALRPCQRRPVRRPVRTGLAAHPVAGFPQFDLQPARAVAAFVVVKNRHHFRFPGRLLRTHRPARLRQPPRVIAAGHYAEHLAELLDGMTDSLLVH